MHDFVTLCHIGGGCPARGSEAGFEKGAGARAPGRRGERFGLWVGRGLWSIFVRIFAHLYTALVYRGAPFRRNFGAVFGHAKIAKSTWWIFPMIRWLRVGAGRGSRVRGGAGADGKGTAFGSSSLVVLVYPAARRAKDKRNGGRGEIHRNPWEPLFIESLERFSRMLRGVVDFGARFWPPSKEARCAEGNERQSGRAMARPDVAKMRSGWSILVRVSGNLCTALVYRGALLGSNL